MDKNAWIIFFIIYVGAFSVNGQYASSLRFIPNPNVIDRKIMYELDDGDINIDASFQFQVLVKYIQKVRDYYDSSLTFYCYVNELSEKYRINTAYMCKKDTLSSKEDCHLIKNPKTIVQFGENMKSEVTFNERTGLTTKWSLKPKDDQFRLRVKPLDGLYYCKLKNVLGSIESNYIEFQDFEYYRRKVSEYIKPLSIDYQPDSHSNINVNKLPFYFNCGTATRDIMQGLPKWADQNLLSPFMWDLCSEAKTGKQCSKLVLDARKPVDEVFDYYQFINGTIAILGLKVTSGISESSIVQRAKLLCKYNTMPRKVYAIHFGKQDNRLWQPIIFEKSGIYNQRIIALIPENNKIQIREGTYTFNKFVLRASYVANPDHSKRSAEWKRNNYVLSNDMVVSPTEVKFPSEITKSHSGKYTLTVKQSEPNDYKIFTFDVDVVGVPRLKNPDQFPNIIYRLGDQKAELSATFDTVLKKKSIEINGIQVDLSSPFKLQDTLTNLVHQFPLLQGIVIKPEIPDSGPIDFKYYANNLSKNKGAPQAKTHSVTFVAENDIGVSKISCLILVFDKPNFIHKPSSFNCTSDCLSSEPHTFKCAIDEKEFTTEGLKVEYLWYLNKENLNNMNSGYIQMDYMVINGSTVYIKPIQTDDTGKDDRMANILRDAVLSCSVRISSGKDSKSILYDSQNYPEIKPLLDARIRMSLSLVARGSPTWVLPLIICLIILVIVIVLVSFFCLRSTGESYNVDQKERAQGHDPEKEIREMEMFQAYERDQDNHVMQGSRLSFNDEDSVGVGSDDGELDQYDVDPGKFNEEGSFIGQYASDPRKHRPANGGSIIPPSTANGSTVA